ncbi:MAG: NUDIX hydrolase [Bacteroidota bacterium]
MNWKTISSEYINKHIFFTARRDRCLRSDGTLIDPYYVVELPVSATALPVTENGEVVLVKQYRHPINETIIETPGGFIEEGEDAATGLKRELLEETGYSFTHIEPLGRVAANPGLLNNFTELFLATGGKKTNPQQLDHNEEIEILLVSMDELIRMLLAGEIKQSLHVNCIFYALMKMGKLQLC